MYNRKSRHYGGENPEWPVEVEAAVATLPPLFDRPHRYGAYTRLVIDQRQMPAEGYRTGDIDAPWVTWRECVVCGKKQCAVADAHAQLDLVDALHPEGGESR